MDTSYMFFNQQNGQEIQTVYQKFKLDQPVDSYTVT